MRRTLIALWLPILISSGCSHFDYVLDEFDSVTSLDLQTGEPVSLTYLESPKQWSWIVHASGGTGFDWILTRVFGLEPSPELLDNPSSFVRERLAVLTEQAAGDLVRSAQAASRLLWIAAHDQIHALNQTVALSGLTEIMKGLELEPLGQPHPPPASDRARAAHLVDRRILAAGWPTRRARGFSPDDRRAYIESLANLAQTPAADARQGRDLLRDLAYRLPLEGDSVLWQATESALRAVLANETAQGLRNGLRSISPEVREAAILALYQLGGPEAVPYCLAVLQSRRGGAAAFDPSPELRRVLVRICGQLRGEILYLSVSLAPGQQGPMPIRFLYETARDDRENGLRAIALESMALCLGLPIVFDQQWADQWWSDFIARGMGRKSGGS